MSSESWRKYVVPTPERLTPKRHRGSIVNYGPMELGLREEVVYEGGPDEFIANNPQLFATGTTSSHEGYAYWALLKIIGEPGVPGKNGLVWYYQSKVGGGSNRAGGAVVDFMVEGALPSRDIGIRIVTPFFHDQAGAFKRAEDFEQTFMLLDNDILVVDVNSRNYITDHTGVAAIQAMTKAIEGRPDYNPLFRRWGV
jgi:hypothetical protein